MSALMSFKWASVAPDADKRCLKIAENCVETKKTDGNVC